MSSYNYMSPLMNGPSPMPSGCPPMSNLGSPGMMPPNVPMDGMIGPPHNQPFPVGPPPIEQGISFTAPPPPTSNQPIPLGPPPSNQPINIGPPPQHLALNSVSAENITAPIRSFGSAKLVQSSIPNSTINPATNDSPLEFNTEKNFPSVISSHVNGNGPEISIIDETIVLEPHLRRDRSSHRSRRSHSKDKDRDRSRVRDRRGNSRDLDRERVRERNKERNRRESDSSFSRASGSSERSVKSSNNSSTACDDITPNQLTPGPSCSTQVAPENNAQSNQSYGPIPPPWSQIWGPMGNPMGPMGSIGAPVGPMPPIGPMCSLGGPMVPPSEPPPLTGDFRISLGMFGWVMSSEGTTVPVKNSLYCKTCVLVPPNRMAPLPTTRDRPSGCRTVFVGGLPENVTEEIVRDVFERCGEIATIRLSKKNFCHIRYELEEFVDNGIFLSGYRMRINNSSESANTGRLHVDYAQARDDQYEFECRQRQLQREQRHRERMEAERLRPPSPPPVVHFSEHEASNISEQLKVDESFSRASQILSTWLERGDCTKRNAGTFYSMVQSTNSHVRRLMTEKTQFEDELNKFKEQTRARIQGVVIQFGQIERVFTSASHQKVWDHFTKPQRRNIEVWKKQAEEIKNVQFDECDKDDAEEMDVSDDDLDDESSGKRKKNSLVPSNEWLKEENDSLRCQMEAYKNEVDLVKADLRTEVSSREEQIQVLKKTLLGMQQTLTENAAKKRQDESRLSALKEKLRLLESSSGRKDKTGTTLDTENSLDTDDIMSVSTPCLTVSDNVSERTALLVGLISIFLHIHPKGASVDYIWSYVQQFDKEIRSIEIEDVLNLYPSVFKQLTTGVGACMERKWIFIGLKIN